MKDIFNRPTLLTILFVILPVIPIYRIASKQWKNNSVKMFLQEYENIPESQQQILKDYNWVILFIDCFAFKESKHSYLTGIIGYPKYSIILSSASSENKLIHCCGHVLDCIFGWVSDSQEFHTIIEAEKQSLKELFDNKVLFTNNAESFARSYELFVSSPHVLKEYCPLLYDMHSKLVTRTNLIYQLSLHDPGKITRFGFLDMVKIKFLMIFDYIYDIVYIN